MRRKNQIFKRICACLCAVVVVVGSFGVADFAYADDAISIPDAPDSGWEKHIIVHNTESDEYYLFFYSDSSTFYIYRGGSTNYFAIKGSAKYYKLDLELGEWTYVNQVSNTYFSSHTLDVIELFADLPYGEQFSYSLDKEKYLYKAPSRWGLFDEYTLYWGDFGNDLYKLDESICDCGVQFVLPKEKMQGYDYYMILRQVSSGQYRLIYANEPFTLSKQSNGVLCKSANFHDIEDSIAYYCTSSDGINWGSASKFTQLSGVCDDVKESGKYVYKWFWQVCETNYWVINSNSGGINTSGKSSCYFWEPTTALSGAYDATLGYLQNVTRKSTYIRDALYNYDDDSLTYHWTHDLTSSTGVDLSGGNYFIRHYISNATVTGYEKEDIVEMSKKYLVSEYDASLGGFSYLQKDYDDKLKTLGYDDIGWVDSILRGYFVLQHHYFQIVNSDTNDVGGYLHFYPKDATGDSFGVEMMYEGLDMNGDVVEDAPGGYIDTQTGSGLTHEDALQNADEPKLDDLGGVDELASNLDVYASQIGGVTSGIGALLGSFPPWMLALLGVSVALSFVVVVFKVLRG